MESHRFILKDLAWFVLIGGMYDLSNSYAAAELYINEVFWDAGADPGGDPPGHLPGDDFRDEYIELRGTPNMSLANHYLIFLESEDNASHTLNAGKIDNIFDLGNCGLASCTIGSNGFLTIREKGNLYDNFYGGVAPGTTDVVNSGSGAGYGSGAESSIGHSSTDPAKANVENGGWTAMLIRNNGDPVAARPTIGQDLDVGNNGLDSVETAVNGWRANWTIIDSLGVHAEGMEAYFGRTYAQVNFGTILIGEELSPGTNLFFNNPNIEPGAVYVGVPWSLVEREIEYVARWGNSTGQTPDDWHVSNVSQRIVAGSPTGAPDYRQSGEPHADGADDPPPSNQVVESTKGVPYRAPLLHTLGQPNYPFLIDGILPGDYNEDGIVDAADFTLWGDHLGQTDFKLANEGATPVSVTPEDYDVWKLNFGETPPGAGSAAGVVPEPASWLLAMVVAAMFGAQRRR